MTSHIKGLDSQSVDSGGARPVAAAARITATAATATPAQTDGDNVQITTSARQMAALAQTIRDTPDVDSDRVQSLQQSLAQGSYSIDAGRIADRMLQLEQDLGAT